MQGATSRNPSPLALGLVAAALVSLLLALGEQLSDGFAGFQGLSGAETAWFLWLATGALALLATGYALFVAAFVGGVRRFEGGAERRRAFWQRLRDDAAFDLRATAAVLATLVSLAFVLLVYLVYHGSADPQFLAKRALPARFFTVVLLALIGVAALLWPPFFVAARALLRLVRVEHWGRSARLPLVWRLLGLVGLLAGAAAAFVVLRLMANEETQNVMKMPLFLLMLVGLHALLWALAYRLRAAAVLRWLGRPFGRLAAAVLLMGLLAPALFAFSGSAPVKDAIERQTTYVARVVQLLRKVLDADRDGYAALLGGGDCADFNASINPGADDVPGNGIDEDCRDGDADPSRIAKGFQLDPELAALQGAPAAAAAPPAAPAGAPPAADAGAAPAAAPGPAAAAPPPAAGDPVSRARQLASDKNLLIVLIDTVRADHVSAYGYGRATTPRLDAFAKQAWLFRRAFSQANHTPRSMPSIFTGRYPSQIHWVEFFQNFSPIRDENVTLFELLSQNGFHTIGVFQHWYFGEERNMHQGFAVWDNSGAKSLAEGNTLSPAPDVTRKALAHITAAKQGGKRFAAFVHYMDPHARYMEHPELKTFDSAQDGAPGVFKECKARKGCMKWLDRYDGEVYWTDHYMGKLLDGLRELGLEDETVVVVLADHGEGFYEHRYLFHGQNVYNEVLHVPLVMRVPGLAEPRDVPERVALVDLFPTVLDLFGIAADIPLAGESLLPIVLGGARRSKPIFAELNAYPNFNEDMAALTIGDLKVIWTKRGDRFELYDLSADPFEQKNLFGRHDKSEALKRALLDWLDTEVKRP